MTRSLKTSLIISILFVAILRFRPIWERYPGGLWNVLFFLGTVVLFFWLVIKIIIELVRLIKRRKGLKIKLFVPILIMTVFLLDGMYNPFKIGATRRNEMLEKHKAGYFETNIDRIALELSFAYIKENEANKSFEIAFDEQIQIPYTKAPLSLANLMAAIVSAVSPD